MIITLLRKIASGLMMLFLVIGSLSGAVAGKMMVEGHRGKDAQIGLLIGLGFWGLAALMAWLSVLKKKKEKFREAEGGHSKADSGNEGGLDRKDEVIADMNDDAFYEQVAEEMKTDNLIPGVWTRAFAEADGDENRAKSIYIKLRIAKLLMESRSRNVGETDDVHELENETQAISDKSRMTDLQQILAEAKREEDGGDDEFVDLEEKPGCLGTVAAIIFVIFVVISFASIISHCSM